MFESNKPRQIDLHLPTGWNRCTTEELEAIAAAIIQEQQRVDRYHPFDWSRVKLGIVLSINSLTPCPSPKGEGSSQPSNISHQPSDIDRQSSVTLKAIGMVAAATVALFVIYETGLLIPLGLIGLATGGIFK